MNPWSHDGSSNSWKGGYDEDVISPPISACFASGNNGCFYGVQENDWIIVIKSRLFIWALKKNADGTEQMPRSIR